MIRVIKNQLRTSKTYIGLLPSRGRHAFVRDLRRKMRDIQQALGDATSDKRLPKKYVFLHCEVRFPSLYCKVHLGICDDDDRLYLVVWVPIKSEHLLHVYFNLISYTVSMEKLEQWS